MYSSANQEIHYNPLRVKVGIIASHSGTARFSTKNWHYYVPLVYNCATRRIEQVYDYYKDKLKEPIITKEYKEHVDDWDRVSSKVKAIKIAKRMAESMYLAFSPKSDVVDLEELTGPRQPCLLCEKITHRGHERQVCQRCQDLHKVAVESMAEKAAVLISPNALLPDSADSQELTRLIGEMCQASITKRSSYREKADISIGGYEWHIPMVLSQATAAKELVELINRLIKRAEKVGFRKGHNLLMRLADPQQELFEEINEVVVRNAREHHG
jgi:hypothetical protein